MVDALSLTLIDVDALSLAAALALSEAETDPLAKSLTDALWLCESYMLLRSDSRVETLICTLFEIRSCSESLSLSLKE
jgi:hypothetical protein